MKPKVLIAVPYHSHIEEECRDSIDAMLAYCASEGKYDVIFKKERCSDLAQGRNSLIHFSLDNGFAFILHQDADQTSPPDALSRLMAHDKDIVCATACKRGDDKGKPVGQPLHGGWKNSGLIEMDVVGSCFMLQKLSIFHHSKIVMPAYCGAQDVAFGQAVACDNVFCAKARDAGFKIWCDMGLTKEIGHIGKKTFYVNL